VFLGRDVQLSDFIGEQKYLSYQDFFLNLLPQTCLVVMSGLPIPSFCWKLPFFFDRYLIYKLFHRKLFFWPAHVPKLWDRCVMYELESPALLQSYLNISRRNRIRTPATDVNVHLHYESMLFTTVQQRRRFFMDKPVNPQPFMDASTQGKLRNLYFFKLFRGKQLTDGSAWSLEFRGYINSFRPLFISIEDEDSAEVPNEDIELHRKSLEKVLSLVWPVRASWENAITM
jgi:hypothetical protein